MQFYGATHWQAFTIVALALRTGNKGPDVALSWMEDTVPPITRATIASLTHYVPALLASIVNTSFVSLSVNASEAVRAYRVVVSKKQSAGVSTQAQTFFYTGSNGVIEAAVWRAPSP